MECYGEKMLPRGLPELVYQITPPEISKDLKIISFNNSKGKGAKGRVGCDNNYYIMELFPTVIISDNSNAYSGTQSFCYWLGFLRTILHEIGHIVTNELVSETYHQRYEHDSKSHDYIEKLADDWRDQAIEKIASRDNRLGQPEGWIGGLPGIYILRRGKIRDNTFGRFESRRVKDIRAKKCGGQHGIDDITKLVWADSPCKWKVHCVIKEVATGMGIYRAYFDSAGRKHLFFNHNEARAVATEMRKLPLLKSVEGRRSKTE